MISVRRPFWMVLAGVVLLGVLISFPGFVGGLLNLVSVVVVCAGGYVLVRWMVRRA